MRPEEIRPNDWMRILIGEVPNSYFLELVLRMAVVYLILTISMRLMGKRMAAQLSRNDWRLWYLWLQQPECLFWPLIGD